ncbi:MAG: hypothetical protein JSV44_08250 [Candidatus Zixiibacteriota bacterium]|nr:MAG: hypothetical protein JSV44_08250 [candidate division Zixibacteria bacterium]
MDASESCQNNDDAESSRTASLKNGATQFKIERGTCYILFAYDVGLSINLDDAERRITSTKYRQTIKHKRRAPHYFEYDPPPLRITENVKSQSLFAGYCATTNIDATIYDFGAILVTYSIPLSGSIFELLSLSNKLYDNNQLISDSRNRIEQLVAMIEHAITKPKISSIVEDYIIYQIETLKPVTGISHILADNSHLLAQILRAESSSLSDQEVEKALACCISFSDDDMLIVDWNATLLFDTDADDVLAVLEYANVELLEMRYLDDQLDNALDESYKALTKRRWERKVLFRSPADDLRHIAELQVDSALLFEGVNNAIKLLGDQYLARVYRLVSDRLHLNEWDTNIMRKLQTIESIYEKISSNHSTRRLELLEWIIIILIAVSIAVSIIPKFI